MAPAFCPYLLKSSHSFLPSLWATSLIRRHISGLNNAWTRQCISHLPIGLPNVRIIAFICTAILLATVFYTYDVSQALAIGSRLSSTNITFIAALLTANLLLVSVRFHLLLRRFGVRLGFFETLRANTLAQVTSVFLLPILGHILGRAAFLKRHALPASILASVTMYEKIVTLTSASILCVFGLYFLYRDGVGNWVSSTIGDIHLPQILLIGSIAFMVSFRLGALRLERTLWKKMLSRTAVITTLETGLVTLLAHACMLAAYTSIVTDLPSPVSAQAGLAASSIIMFLAGLPISVSGWGVRELASIYFLGELNVPAEEALGASVFMGLAALGCLLAAGLLMSMLPDRRSPISATGDKQMSSAAGLNHDKAIVVLLATLTSVSLFFQFHVPVQGNVIAVNAADPLALTGGALFLVYWAHRRQLPNWRYDSVQNILLAATGIIFFSFVVGYLSFGVTPWALSNRLIGWLVILAYIFTGAGIVSLWGNNGTRRVLESIGAAGGLVAAYMLVTTHLTTFRLIEFRDNFFPAFSEMSPNRNAVAFQLLLALAGVLALCSRSTKKRFWLVSIGSGVIATGVILTGSRAGMGTLAAVALAAIVLRFISFKAAAVAALVTLCLLFAPPITGTAAVKTAVVLKTTAQDIYHYAQTVLSPSGIATKRPPEAYSPSPKFSFNPTPTSDASSNVERFESIKGGIHMWLENVLIGAGLGAYLHSQGDWDKPVVVIHSTPIWLLAEFGLLGFGIFAAAFVLLMNWALSRRDIFPDTMAARCLVLVLLAFAIFSTVHEILYQRIFWFMLGACLAASQARRIARTASPQALTG